MDDRAKQLEGEIRRLSIAMGVQADEIERLRVSLRETKALVCGDRAPRWIEDGITVTMTRGVIADICDVALDDSKRNSP